MKKSKIFVISALALVMAASLVFGFAAIKSAPATVSATTADTVYFTNNAGWGTVYAYAWKGEGGEGDKNAEWPGVVISRGANGYYEYTVTGYEKIIFHNGAGTQTGDINVEDKIYVYSFDDSVETLKATKVEYAPVTYYYYNEDAWTGVNAYTWKEGGFANKDYPGLPATAVDGKDGWYSYSVSPYFEKIIFSNSENKSDQTGNLTIDSKNTYYKGNFYNSIAVCESVLANYATIKANPGYYLVGVINGDTEGDDDIDFCRADYPLTTMAAGDFAAEKWGVTLAEGDKLKIRYFWVNGSDELESKWSEGDNYVITEGNAGTYNIGAAWGTGVDDGKLYHSFTPYTAEDFKIAGIKYKVSTETHKVGDDDKYYLLLVAGITLDGEKNYTGYSIGFCLNGKIQASNTYYTGISVKTATDPVTYKVNEGGFFTGSNGLIVQEFEIDADDISATDEIIAYVYNGVTVVDSAAFGK